MNSFWTDARPAPAASSLPALLGAPALRPAFLEIDSRGPAANSCVTRETLGGTTARPPGCSPLCALASGRTGIPVEWSEEHVKEHTSRTWPSAQHTAALGHAADTCAGLPDCQRQECHVSRQGSRCRVSSSSERSPSGAVCHSLCPSADGGSGLTGSRLQPQSSAPSGPWLSCPLSPLGDANLRAQGCDQGGHVPLGD